MDKTSLVLFKQLISKFLKQNGTIIIATHDLTIVEDQFNILDLDDFKKQRVSWIQFTLTGQIYSLHILEEIY